MKTLKALTWRAGDTLDGLLDRLTTYRLVLYLLAGYAGLGIIFALGHKFPFTAFDLAVSIAWLLVVCRAANWLFAIVFKVPRNYDSDLITALILSLILPPSASGHGLWVMAGAAVVAVASKYILTINKRHLFNPAALGALASGKIFGDYASWWVGSHYILPLVAVGAVLILRKMKRFQMFFAFLAIFAVCMWFIAPSSGFAHSFWVAIDYTPLIFFASIMLTEPMTSPTMRNQSFGYALIVGIGYSLTRLHLSPEDALLIGNLATFAMNPNRSLLLSFAGAKTEAKGIYSFYFDRPGKKLNFLPGQYMEWTLGGISADSRGNRRYLTVASSPTESQMMFSVKIPADKHSSFKTSLINLKPGDKILASQVAGDFTLPKGRPKKMAFIAGGVGITPYRSMIKYLVDKNLKRDIHLFYCVNDPAEIAYGQLLKTAGSVGLTSHFVLTNKTPLDGSLIKDNLPDYIDRQFFISGPQGFVAAVRHSLMELGVNHRQIVTDFFPGYN